MGHSPTTCDAALRISRSAALCDSVGRLRYVSGARGAALERLGIRRVRDLFAHIPKRYLDFTHLDRIGEAAIGEQATIVARVDQVKLKRPRPGMKIVEVSVVDETGVLIASFFKQPWIADQVHEDDLILLSGKVTFAYGFRQMKGPFYEVVGNAVDGGSHVQVLPVYPVGEGITVAWMRRIVSAALADAADVCDFVPAQLITEHHLMSSSRALRQIHYPNSLESAGLARRRLAYDELLCLQLALMCRQSIELAHVTPHTHVIDGPNMKALLAAMPFELTDEQRQAGDEILADMASKQVMNRLLLGDVGTGKTAVAALGLAAAADSGTQAAMMAPTSVLARQYAEKLGPLLTTAGITWAFVTGATPADERAAAAAGLADGSISVVFGTTALLSDDITFDDLSLVIVDEQHRFGVDQRAALRAKGASADMLTATATPIPRTLALSVYGDLACSRIAHRPNPGAGITTKVVTPENVDLAYGSIRSAVDAGHQAYVVCPLVDDADTGEELDAASDELPARRLKSVSYMYEELSGGPFRDMRVGKVTGRMSASEKDDVMARFRAHELDVLVSTTVIEVGVDVPNATAMVVFDADCFGLAALHQLRGRVGRGDVPGVVHLVAAAAKGTPARSRLDALERTSDGMELAELDLRLRHEGEVMGYRQSGGVTLRVVDMLADADLIEAAHADARAIADVDPMLSQPIHRPLASEVSDRFGIYFEEAGEL